MKDDHNTHKAHTISDALLDNLSEMVIRLEPDGIIRYVNRVCLKLVDLKEGELIGKDLSLILPHDDLLNLKRHFNEVIKGRSTHSIAVSAKGKDSAKLSLKVLLVPNTSEGKVESVWLRAENITGHRKLESELNETKRFLENIITSAEEGFVTLNKDGIVLKWSKGAENIFDILPKNIIGRPFYSILKNKIQSRRFIDRLREVIAGRSIQAMEYVFLKDNDQVVHLSVSSSPVMDRSGKTKEIVLIIKDSTEKKHLEERLKESEKRLATEVIKKIEDLKYIEQLNRLVVQYMEEGAILLDPKLEIGFVNPTIVNLLGFSEEELIGMSIETIIPEDLTWVWSEIPERSKKGSFRFETSLVRKDGEEVPVMVTASSIRIETKKSEFLCSVIDLTTQKMKEDEIREEMMEYKIKSGSVFMMVESGYSKVADVLATLRRFGHNILIISRRSVKARLEPLIDDPNTSIYWLEERGRSSRSLPPKKDDLHQFFEKKVNRTTVIMLDRLDYLISKMTFPGLLDLLHSLVELFYHRKAILLLIVDPITMGDKEIRQLEKDALILEPKRAVIIPDDLLEVLIFINKENKMNHEPSYKDVGNRFGITKTTTRKRLHQLLILELLIETKKGRTKVLKVSDKGRRFIPIGPSKMA